MCTPVLRQLKLSYPGIHLTFGTEFCEEKLAQQLLQGNTFLDNLIDYRYYVANDYDYIFDITSVAIQYEQPRRKPKNRIDIFAKACGVTLSERLPFYKVTDEELSKAKSLLEGKRCIAIHLFASEEKRSWPIEKYNELIASTPEYHFLLIDNCLELNSFPNTIDISESSLREKAAFIKASELFLGPDSGPMHIAGALNVPSLVLFGATPPESRINYYPNHYSITSNQICLGCWYSKCPFERKCMKDIDYLYVSDLVHKLMEQKL